MKTIFALLSGALVTLAGSSAFSQTSSTELGPELEEIIVTAEIRKIDLQKTAQSIQVYSGDQLAREGKRRVDEILAGVTGVTMQPDQGGQVTVFMRGAGNLNGITTNTVTLLVDGVAQSGLAVRGSTLDVSQVEVMRGAQSTTMNAGALTGALSLVTNKPAFEYQGSGSIEAGNYNLLNYNGVLNVPFGDKQAVRLAFDKNKRDGYMSSNAGDSDQSIVRLKYRWQPNDNFEIVATGTDTHIGGNGVSNGVLLYTGHWVPNTGADIAGTNQVTGITSLYPINTLYPTALNAANAAVVAPQYSYAMPCSASATNIATLITTSTGTQPFIRGLGCPAAYIAVRDGVNWYDRDDPWDDGLPRNAFPNNPLRDTKTRTAQLDINWTTQYGTLTLIPSFQHSTFKSVEPPNTTGGWMGAESITRTRTMDARWASNSNSKLVWTSGLYYSYTGGSVGQSQDVNAPTTAWPTGMAGTAYTGAAVASATTCYAVLPGATPTARGTINSPCYGTTSNKGSPTTNYAALANFTYSLLDSLRLTAGARQDWSKLDSRNSPDYLADQDGSNPYLWTLPPTTFANATTANPNAIFVVPQKMYLSAADLAVWEDALRVTSKQKRFNYSLGVEYDVLPQAMVYATYKTASRAGSVDSMNGDTRSIALPNARTAAGAVYAPSITIPTPAKLMEVKSSALGFKSRWFDNKLQFNIEAFNNDYHNRRLSEMISTLYGLTDTTSTLTCSTSINNPFAVQLGTSLATSCFNANINGYTGDMVTRGFDLDINYLPTSQDRIDLAVEYLRSIFTDVPDIGTLDADTILAAAGADASKRALAQQIADNYNNFLSGATGKTLQNAPRWSVNMTYQHQFGLPGGSTLTPRVIGYYKSAYWTRGGSAAGTPGVSSSPLQEASWAIDNDRTYPLVQKGYTLFDFYTTWLSGNGKFSVSAYVKNIANKAIMQNSSSVGGITTGSIATNDLAVRATGGTVALAPPRTYALSVQASF